MENYNILLTNISTLSKEARQAYKEGNHHYFSYSYEKNKSDIITGLMTNEPCAKYIINKLHNNNEILNEIMYVASNKVLQKEIENSNEEKISHAELFEEQIYDHFDQMNIELECNIYNGYRISDNPDSEELIKASSSIAKIINDKANELQDKTINIYVDSNGGLRDFMVMILAILNTLSKNIVIKEIVGVNMSTKTIENKTLAYKIFSLYSGIDEFINYGRSTLINEYLQDMNIKLVNKQQKVITSIDKMCDAFSLCRTEAIISETKNLSDAITQYEASNNRLDIIDYLVQRIREEYNEVFEACAKEDKLTQITTMISFCSKHNMVQQALTLYSEKMPEVYIEQGIILFPTDTQRLNHFNEFYDDNSHYSEAYTYIQQYLFNYHNGLVALYNEEHSRNKIYVESSVSSKVTAFSTMFNSSGYIATKFVHRKEDVIEAMKIYLTFKELRNNANHANDYENNSFRTVEQIKNYIEFSLDKINTFK